MTTRRRRIYIATTCILFASLTITLMALAAPAGHLNWQRLSDIGQAFGTVSALLSAIAILGVVTSLRYQQQQVVISQYQVARENRTKLLQFAIDNPRHLSAWGYHEVHAGVSPADFAYISLVFSYHKMAYTIGTLQRLELSQFCARIFQNPDAVNFWKEAREVYLDTDSSTNGPGFAAIVDKSYQTALRARHSTNSQHPEHLPAKNHRAGMSVGPPRRRNNDMHTRQMTPNLLQHLATFCLGIAIGRSILPRQSNDGRRPHLQPAAIRR